MSFRKKFQKLVKLNDANSVKKLLDFIKEYNLQPILRTTYNRTAFQIPGDDESESIDSNLTFIEKIHLIHPIRDPQQWHRLDLDNSKSRNNS